MHPCGTDAFVRDLDAGTTERVSVAAGGRQANGDSGDVSLSADGRLVAFSSAASNLVPGDTNGRGDVFVRDRRTGRTERVSVAAGGRQANGDSWSGCISDDGGRVVFTSEATDLVPGDTNGSYDVFVRDRTEGTTERVSVSSGGAQGNKDSFVAGCGGRVITPGGRYVVFELAASDLVRGDTNGYCGEGVCATDVFVRDRLGA